MLVALVAASYSFLFGVWPRLLAAAEVLRQTSAGRRRAKSLMPYAARARARMSARVLFGRPAENFDAAEITIGGCAVEVDHRLAELVARLNAAGVPTVACCQGWHDEASAVSSKRTGLHATQGAFLMVAPHYAFPDEIMEAVVRSRSRLQIGARMIQVAAAYTYDSELFAANAAFEQLLDDWARSEVDRTGLRYCAASLGLA